MIERSLSAYVRILVTACMSFLPCRLFHRAATSGSVFRAASGSSNWVKGCARPSLFLSARLFCRAATSGSVFRAASGSLSWVKGGALGFVLMGESIAWTETIPIQMRETAGLQRFQYPVTGVVPVSNVSEEVGFRLSRQGKDVPVQVTRHAGSQPSVTLDFNISCLPQETQTFQLEVGPDVPKPKGSLRTITARLSGEDWLVQGTGALTYRIPARKGGQGLVSSAILKDEDWLTGGGELYVLTREGAVKAIATPDFSITPWQVDRQGSHACVLSFVAKGNQPALNEVVCRGRLVFPLAKSWIEMQLEFDDPQQRLQGVGLSHNCSLTEKTTLVDFSAVDLTYLTLSSGMHSELKVSPDTSSPTINWEILRGSRATTMTPFAKGQGTPLIGGGWGHVMDTRRCTAIAVADMGRQHIDRFSVDAQGKYQIERRFHRTGAKTLHLWAHFVHFPPHITAVTSPQAMLNPLVVTVAR